MANRSSKSKANSDSKTEPDSHGVRSDKPRRPKAGLPRFAAAVRNGLEIARKGGLVERKPSPFEIVAEGENFREVAVLSPIPWGGLSPAAATGEVAGLGMGR